MTVDPAPGSNGVPLSPMTPYGRPVYGPPSYGQPGYLPSPYGQQGYVQPGMLASAADRDRTVDVLKAAFTEGRITKEEFDIRTGRVMSARTYADLGAVIADLPSGLGPALAQPYPYFRSLTAAPRTSALAIASLACGILFPVGAIPAVVLGHAARSQLERTRERGAGLAAAGLVLGYLGIAVWVLLIIVAAGR